MVSVLRALHSVHWQEQGAMAFPAWLDQGIGEGSDIVDMMWATGNR